MRILRTLFALWLSVVALFSAQSVMESPARTYILGTGVSLTFGTHEQCRARWPEEFKLQEPPGWYLHGEFQPRGYKSHTRDVIFIVVADPGIYTEDYLGRVVRALYYLNLHGFKLDQADLLTDVADDQFAEAGILQHECAHLSDHKPRWHGQQALMLHDLFPKIVPKPSRQEPSNPWQIVRMFWPECATHAGFDAADYSHGFVNGP